MDQIHPAVMRFNVGMFPWEKIVRFQFIALIASFGLLAACSQTPSSGSKPFGFVTAQDDTWKTLEIPVCWEQDTLYPGSKTIVQNTVTQEYDQSGIHFTGWKTCDGTQTVGFKLFFREDTGSEVDSIGSSVQRLTLGTGHSCMMDGKSVGYMDSNCLGNVALHEFGHAIGLHHEMNRSDLSFEECTSKQMVEVSALNIGKKDLDSVMNYCKIFSSNNLNLKLGLSTGDKSTIRELYFGSIAYLRVDGSDEWELLPERQNFAKLSIEVYNNRSGIDSYRYKLIKGGEDCQTVGTWQEAAADVKLSGSMLTSHPTFGEQVRVCVVSNKVLDESNYTSYDFVIIDPNYVLANDFDVFFFESGTLQLRFSGPLQYTLAYISIETTDADGVAKNYYDFSPFKDDNRDAIATFFDVVGQGRLTLSRVTISDSSGYRRNWFDLGDPTYWGTSKPVIVLNGTENPIPPPAKFDVQAISFFPHSPSYQRYAVTVKNNSRQFECFPLVKLDVIDSAGNVEKKSVYISGTKFYDKGLSCLSPGEVGYGIGYIKTSDTNLKAEVTSIRSSSYPSLAEDKTLSLLSLTQTAGSYTIKVQNTGSLPIERNDEVFQFDAEGHLIDSDFVSYSEVIKPGEIVEETVPLLSNAVSVFWSPSYSDVESDGSIRDRAALTNLPVGARQIKIKSRSDHLKTLANSKGFGG